MTYVALASTGFSKIILIAHNIKGTEVHKRTSQDII